MLYSPTPGNETVRPAGQVTNPLQSLDSDAVGVEGDKVSDIALPDEAPTRQKGSGSRAESPHILTAWDNCRKMGEAFFSRAGITAQVRPTRGR